MKRNINIKKPVSIAMLLLATLFTGTLFQACEKSDKDTGMPVVNYIRLNDPAKSDSLIVSALMGNIIVLMGENMQDVNQIWFNDQQASVNTNLVTSNAIIVTVPNVIPGVVTNQMRLITSNKKDTLVVPFNVKVPGPQLDAMLCEYVPTGSTAVIKGNYFVNDINSPLKVFFPGNIEGTVTDVTINEIKVTVPAGSGVGPIQVKTIYGSTNSTFFFRDDRNILLDFDTKTAAGGWRSGVIKDSPDPISGNYVKFAGTMKGKSGATWNEDAFSFDLWPIANGRPDVPVYTGDLSKAVIKFECNVVEPWQAGALQMIFTPYSVTGKNSYIGDDPTVPRGLWIPWKATGTYKTAGWITVTIPLSEFKYKADGSICANALTADMISGLTFFIFGGGVDGVDGTITMYIDNIRVVTK